MTKRRGAKGAPFAGSWGSVTSVSPGGGAVRSSAAGEAGFSRGARCRESNLRLQSLPPGGESCSLCRDRPLPSASRARLRAALRMIPPDSTRILACGVYA